MLSRISSFFKQEEERQKPDKHDLKDLLLQIKALSSEEKQIIRHALDTGSEEQLDIKEALKMEVETSTGTNIVVKQPEDKVVTTEVAPSYEYTQQPYKRSQD
jgi:hypothetical protein